jgi:hypothetical protein
MKTRANKRSALRRAAAILLFALAALVLLIAARCLYAFRDRHPGYGLALNIDGRAAAENAQPLKVGFGRIKINPNISDPDRPIYIAGFSQNRVATAIHDDLWAVACVLDDGQTRLGIAVIDGIGFFHDDVVSVRQRLAPELGLDYTIVCSTHNHSTPDLMGLWGPHYLRTGVDARYREKVIAAVAQAFSEAVSALRPARVAFHEIPCPTEGLVADTRKPNVFDPDIRVMHFTGQDTPATLGSLVTWGNHPETPWSKNTEITADFPGFLREILEHGVMENGQRMERGLGGVHLYINGAIGGLMSTTPKVTVHDPYLERDFQEPSHDKSRAVARQLARRIFEKLREDAAPGVDSLPISIHARTLDLPLDNMAFLLAPVLGLIDRGHVRWKTVRSEVALLTLGEASIACIPGEIYPELVNGGVERAPGGDFDIDPLEVPPIRELMPGRIKFIFGLANDEIGYIIPKSQWDRRPPYLYGSKKPVYGEINSLGPETAHRLQEVFHEWRQKK